MHIKRTIERRETNCALGEPARGDLMWRLIIVSAVAQNDEGVILYLDLRCSADDDNNLALIVPMHRHKQSPSDLSSHVNGPFAGSPRTSAEEQFGNSGTRMNFTVEGLPAITESASSLPSAIDEHKSAANSARLRISCRGIVDGASRTCLTSL